MRAKLGDGVVVFDRLGNEYQTQIIDIAKKKITLTRLATTRPERKLATDITIVAALPKGDRQKFLIEKMVELGVAKFIPLITPRSVAQVNAKVISRIEKQIIEATKQCRRSYLMEITAAQTISEVINAHQTASARRYIAHPYHADRLSVVSNDHPNQQAQPCIWLIGPEGGFSDQEVADATGAGWTAISFGSIILRIETAALVAAVHSSR